MMIESPTLSTFLSIADIAVKLAAVLIGGWWTLWNYLKGRTYEQKLELEILSTVFIQGDVYGDARLVVRNIGAARHAVQHEGTICELFVIREDLSEESVALFRVFSANQYIEPGEAMNDTFCWRIPGPSHRILWIKLTLRVVSNRVEWYSTRLVRVQ